MIKKLFPWLVLAVFATEIVAILIPKRDKTFALQDFGRLPVLQNGRVQPFDSVGRNSLLQIRGTASVPLEEKKSYEFWKHPPKLKATEWLLEVMLKPEQADERPVFLIHHPDLLNKLELREKGKAKSGLRYYTFNEITNVMSIIEKEGQQVMKIEDKTRTPYDKQVAHLYNALTLYKRLKNTYEPEGTLDFQKQIADFQAAVGPGVAALRAREANQDYDKQAFAALMSYLGQYDFMVRFAALLMVPPSDPAASPDNWQNMGQVLFDAGLHNHSFPPAVGHFAKMATAYSTGNPEGFNGALREYQSWLDERLPRQVKKARAEFFFNNLQAFLHALIIYLCAFLMGCFSWFVWSEPLRRGGYYITLLAFGVHTAGLLFRMILEGRPPVTNLYSSAVFIGWAAVLLGLYLERVFKDGVGLVCAAAVGATTQVIAHNLAIGGDTMEMMRAVLDSNFWLATHVITITLGYAAMFVAGFMAILYILRGVLTTTLTPESAKALGKMVYGVVCFATLLSFVGTVLGGIWADQSWGRFWGWDPKENGALMIVLWCGVILHARWGGMIRERGLMNMAIIGNVVTSFSWFGVNMLGVGLHSYGFMDAAFKWLMIFIGSQALILGLGLLPLESWKSFRSAAPSSGSPGPTPRDGVPAGARG